ncbi:hypothetical protein pb186bvf_005730 [Paramecium bursaria]
MDFDGNWITDDYLRLAVLSPRQQGILALYTINFIFIIEQDIKTNTTQIDQGRSELNINDLKADIEFSPAKNKKWSLKHISQRILAELQKKPMHVQELTKQFLDEMISSNYCLDLEKDKQNLKRRIYDAVNVLTAIQIIIKDSSDNLSKGKGPCFNRKKSDLIKMKQDLQKRKTEKSELATNKIQEIDTYKALIKYQKSKFQSSDQLQINFPFTAIQTTLQGKNSEEIVIEHNLPKPIFKIMTSLKWLKDCFQQNQIYNNDLFHDQIKIIHIEIKLFQ